MGDGRIKSKRTTYIDLVKNQIGQMIGPEGNHVKEFAERYNVFINISECLFVNGHSTLNITMKRYQL